MTIKKVKTIKALKTRLKKTLPATISKVMDSYEDFLEKEIPDDAKGFGAHHTACKSAVVHAETLLKLAKWTDDDDLENERINDPIDISELMREARKTWSHASYDDDNDED